LANINENTTIPKVAYSFSGETFYITLEDNQFFWPATSWIHAHLLYPFTWWL